jgi:Cu/Zn superoxide dismutase
MRSYYSDTILKFFVYLTMGALTLMTLSCEEEDGPMLPDPTGNTMSYDLMSVSDPGISGTATFTELDDGSTQLIIDLNGTSRGTHPAHIHMNTAAEGGDIAVSLTPVDGSTGMSETIIETLDDGTSISYDQLLDFNGYINVHLSSSDLATLIAQGDIGQNALTGDTKTYTLMEKNVAGIMGTVTFAARENGNTLATIMLEGTPDGGMHPAHIHMNSAAEGGGIAVSFNPVDGTTGMSMTNIEMTDNGEALSYEDILSFDGYVNVHLSMEELSTIVAQGDIGINELTGESYTYTLGEKDVAGIMGSVTFAQRVSGTTLATIMLEGTPDGGMHPAHIHMNSAAEGGGIAVSFTPVDGTSGMSVTDIDMTDDGMALTYEDILNYDGYVNVHLSMEELSTIVAQGDIGANELTGNATTYSLMEKDIMGAMGTVTFAERKNGFTLATIMLEGTPTNGMHPTHIHDNSAEEGGLIAVTFKPVDGNTGMSMTTIRRKDGEDGMALTYEDIISYDGYVNVHLSMEDLATLVAQGDIGSNAEPVE